MSQRKVLCLLRIDGLGPEEQPSFKHLIVESARLHVDASWSKVDSAGANDDAERPPITYTAALGILRRPIEAFVFNKVAVDLQEIKEFATTFFENVVRQRDVAAAAPPCTPTISQPITTI